MCCAVALDMAKAHGSLTADLCSPANPRQMPRPTDPGRPRECSSQGPKPACLSVPRANWCRTETGRRKRSRFVGSRPGSQRGQAPPRNPACLCITFAWMSPSPVLQKPWTRSHLCF